MLKPRDRQLAAIRHKIPDRIPVDAICIEPVDAVAAHLGVKPEAVLPRLGIDGRLVSAWKYLGPRPPAAGAEASSEWGTAASDDYGTAHAYPLASADTLAQIAAYPWPDPRLYDFAESASAARALHSEYAIRGPYWKPLFCQVCGLLGMEEALIRMSLEPKLFEAILARVFEHVREYCRLFLDACGDSLDIFCLGDDFATQRGLLFRPELWRRFLKPRFAELFELGKQRGKFVWFHSCGDITAILPDLIDIGVDVWETVQLHALPLTPVQLKREYGRHLTFFGGINTQHLPFATPAEVRDEVRRVIEALGAGGGFICGPDHHIKPDVPPDNVVALFDAATAFRLPGYTLPAER